MNDRILHTRLVASSRSLGEVQQVLDAVTRQRDELDQLEDLLAGRAMMESLEIVEEAIDEFERFLKRQVRRDLLDEDDRIHDRVRDAIEALEEVWPHLKSAEKIVDSRKKRFTDIERSERVGSTLRLTLVKQAENYQRELDEILEALPAQIDQPAGAGAVDQRQAAWQYFQEQKPPGIETIFSEYVDFLRGLAVRDLGFDVGICRLADDLIERLTNVNNLNPTSLAIVSREKAVDRTLAGIIRLPFPEWSIWALPLAAFEIGRLVTENELLETLFTEEANEDWTDAALRDCLSDAFATYSLGPAYAYAAILLRLSPLDAYSSPNGRASHARRAETIFTMLQHISRRDARDPMAGVIASLRQDWADAMNSAAAVGSLPPGDFTKLEHLVSSLTKFLDVHALVEYAPSAFESIAEWPESMRRGNADIPVESQHDYRDVLNAAWYARYLFPNDVDVIAQISEGLWERVRPKQAGSRRGRIRPRDRSISKASVAQPSSKAVSQV